MDLQLIKDEIDNGSVFIGEYEDVYRIIKKIDINMSVPYSLKHFEAIEIRKINDNYIINPCNNNKYFKKQPNKPNDDGSKIYYGSANYIRDINDMLSLSSFKLENNEKRIVVDAKNDEYIYCCIPSKLGKQHFIVNGFEGGFTLIKSIRFFADKYDIYKSNHSNLGKTIIQII